MQYPGCYVAYCFDLYGFNSLGFITVRSIHELLLPKIVIYIRKAKPQFWGVSVGICGALRFVNGEYGLGAATYGKLPAKWLARNNYGGKRVCEQIHSYGHKLSMICNGQIKKIVLNLFYFYLKDGANCILPCLNGSVFFDLCNSLTLNQCDHGHQQR